MSWRHIEDRMQGANKEHLCFLCGGEIFEGDLYVRRFGYSDGQPFVMKMHIGCKRRTDYWDDNDWLTHDQATFLEEECYW